jgi:hypothetical protein
MEEGGFRDQLVESLGCTVPNRGFQSHEVLSGGISACQLVLYDIREDEATDEIIHFEITMNHTSHIPPSFILCDQSRPLLKERLEFFGTPDLSRLFAFFRLGFRLSIRDT